VDGHDLLVLLEVFRNVRELSGPTFVHAITVKGKGYDVAEEDSRKWHGVAPFSLESNELTAAAEQQTYTQNFGAAAIECAEADARVVAITAAMPDGTGLAQFAKQFPDRYFDVGIAEQHAVTFAAGLAAGGLRPFCAIYSTFLQRGFDQVLHDVCIQNLPVRFFMDRAGLVGDDGPTHHGAFDISFLACLPNMVLLAPRDTTELREMTAFASTYDAGPLAIRYPRGSGNDRLPESRKPISMGKGEILREGSDIAILAIGSMVGPAWDAAALLEAQGVQARVVNARFIKPMDRKLVVDSAKNCRVLLTVEENVQRGGFGEAVRGVLHEEGLAATQHKILALPDRFVEHGAQPIIRGGCGLDADGISQAAFALLGTASHRQQS